MLGRNCSQRIKRIISEFALFAGLKVCPRQFHPLARHQCFVWVGESEIAADQRLLERFNNVPGEGILDLPMPWDGLADFRYGIMVPVVLAAVPDQRAAH
jgi:hypothetical protein